MGDPITGRAHGSATTTTQLEELALDVRWSWNHVADELWRQLDPELWELTHNPWGILQTISRDRVDQLTADPVFRAKIDALVQARRESADAPAWDAAEAEALYTRLETEIVPAFYARDADGVPRGWLTRMRESMARLTPRFSTNRTEREYVEQHYLPAANAFQQRAADQCALGKRIVAWRQAVEQQWDQIGFGRLDVEAGGGQLTCGVEVLLHGIQPGAVGVELYADAIDSADPVRQEMTPVGPVAGTPGGYVYQATLSTTRPASDFTPRVIPHHADARIPLELSRIVWQR